MNANYDRVIPRDLFNESKLLKCIGRLTLLIHDGMGLNDMSFDHDDESFKIAFLDDGYLTVTNIHFQMNGQPLFFKSQYNSKRNYSLFCEYDYCEYLVFDESGQYDEEFITFCKNFKSKK